MKMKLVDILEKFELDRRSFTSLDIQKIFNISKRTLLAYWYNENLLKPSKVDGKGRGARRLYSFEDVLIAGVVQYFLTYGFSHQQVREIVSIIRKRLPGMIREEISVVDAVIILQIRDPLPGEDFTGDCVIISRTNLKDAFDGSGELKLEDSNEPDSEVRGQFMFYLLPIVLKVMRYLS